MKGAKRRDSHAALREFALGYPEATEDFPWGERVVKVRGKVFVFLGTPGGGLHVTVKLPESATLALGLPFAAPCGYGLGKSGWVTVKATPRARPPVALLKQWIDESYRAVAPRALVSRLTTGAVQPSARPKRRPSRKA